MLSLEFAQLAAMALAGIAVGSVVYVLASPYMSDERKARKRFGNVAQAQRTERRRAGPSVQIRKQQVQETLKDIEAKQKPEKASAAPNPLDPRRP